ncbi:uncharacterized protein LOC110227418 [Arabidopsis lyrata subsp. lyrata]|uniref:uncharacterized protein LOC110227418 n=1 Tax=Arabidopsis lyrata subsp. lyrata TaxID=81972 RepID=UPI000A29D5E1|nr:uncharacterized protein LOC110227418 [Arabidopsis lyrata subsp. lyrata]|eukprot:XP_020877171.1 uncharacterized protein LOC110227418 [Arabidopsis lyrata subsp. lyrata]
MDYLSKFSITEPILSFVGRNDSLEDHLVKLYCVHAKAIKQYEDINSGPYTKIYRDFADEDQGYLLNYNDNNLDLNDNRGKNKGLQDYPVHTWRMYDYINIDIYYDEMKIWCETNDLGIYESSIHPKYYKSVIARHHEEGGISVIGFETAEGATTAAAKKEEDENEEASAKMIKPNA